MNFRINIAGTWLPFLSLISVPMMLIDIFRLYNLYAWIVLGVEVVYGVILIIWVLRLSRNFHFLTMERGALVFSNCTIPAEEIKKVTVNQRTGVVILLRKGHKIPLVIGTRLSDKVYFLSDIETWVSENEVKMSVISVR